MTTKWKSLRRIAVRTIVLLLVLWISGCAFLYHTMRKPPEQFASFMAKLPGPVPFLLFPFETLWMQARAGTLHNGDPAPDFNLAKLDKSAHVQLSSFTAQHQPIVLVFGSYT